MRFPGVETVAYPRVSRRRVRSYLEWLRAGRDDYIAISARYAAAGRLPDELAAFVATASVDLIHANHVYTLPLARRVAQTVQRAGGRRPRVLLDTHDIQSKAVADRRQKNPHSRRPDAYEDLLRTELALCAEADALVHLTEADFAFFSSRLPGSRHAAMLPTLHPETEAELVRRRGASRPAGLDFVYVGNQHPANLETVRWLLGEVLPLTAPAVRDRVRIVGSVGDLLGRRDPALFERYRHLFCGEVPSLLDFYAGAKAVLAPAVAGTGTSIKLIEALCIGKPILATPLALRGLPAGTKTGPDIHVRDAAAAFAEAMTGLSEGRIPGAAMSAGNAALYDRLFSNARYFAALASVLDGRTSDSHAPLEAG
jgi:glycosyltransferase involved in cell wall biosynthesis